MEDVAAAGRAPGQGGKLKVATMRPETIKPAAAKKQRQPHVRRGGTFMHEPRVKLLSWSLDCVKVVAALPSVETVRCDMRAVGLVSPPGEPVRKRTSIMTKSPSLVAELRK